MIHILIAFQSLVVVTGIVTTVLFYISAYKKPFLAPYRLFYLSFALMLFLDLLSNYAAFNIKEDTTLFVFLTCDLNEVTGNALLYFAIKTFHTLFKIQRLKLEWLIIFGLSLATVMMISPLGIEYHLDTSTYQLKFGAYVSDFIFFSVFSYLIVISIFRVWGVVDKSDRQFAILLFLFVFFGYLLTTMSSFIDLGEHKIQSLNQTPDLYEPIPLLYFIFSLSLIGIFARTRNTDISGEEALTPENLSQYGFSARETELLPLILSGKSNQQIAEALHISLATVKTHLSKIFKKSVVKSRFELAQKLKA